MMTLWICLSISDSGCNSLELSQNPLCQSKYIGPSIIKIKEIVAICTRAFEEV